MRLIFWVLLSVAFGAAANAAEPTCSAYQQKVAPNSPQCFEAATDLQDTDIVYGVQGTGPSRSNQSVKIPISQLRADSAAVAPVQSVAGRDGDVTLSFSDLSGGKGLLTGSLTNGESARFESYSQLFGTLASGNNYAANRMSITGDYLDYGGSNYAATLKMDHNFGGPTMKGSRANLYASMVMQGSTGNTGNTAQYYVGIANAITCGYNDGGTAGFANAFGSCVAFNPIARLSGTYWYTLNAEEVDTNADAGGSAAHVFGTLNIRNGEWQGTYDDAALAFAVGGGSLPYWKYLIQVGKTDGTSPTDANTTLLGCVLNLGTGAKCNLGYGVDLRNFTIANSAFVSTGFAVDSAGNVAAASLNSSAVNGPGAGVASIAITSFGGIYTSLPTVTLAAPPSGGTQATATPLMGMATWTLIGAGTGYTVNDIISVQDPDCTTLPKLRVTSVGGGGSITGLAGNNGGICSTVNTSTFSVTGGTGTGATVTVNWTVSAVSVSYAGTGYVSSPAVTFTPTIGALAASASLQSSQPLQLSSAGGVTISNGAFTTNGAVVTSGGVRQSLGATYTVPATVSLVRFTQGSTVATSTVTLPTAIGDGQVIQFVNYAGAVTALTFSPAVNGWTNGSTLASYTGLRVRWDATASAWYREQ